MTESDVVESAEYRFMVRPVNIKPMGAQYSAFQDVTLDCETPGAMIYWTDDGSIPSGSSQKRISPGESIRVNKSGTVIKAIAIAEGMLDSGVCESGEYTFKVRPVSIEPNGGKHHSEFQDVTLHCDSPGAQIYWTDDGSDPESVSSRLHTTTIIVSAVFSQLLTSIVWYCCPKTLLCFQKQLFIHRRNTRKMDARSTICPRPTLPCNVKAAPRAATRKPPRQSRSHKLCPKPSKT